MFNLLHSLPRPAEHLHTRKCMADAAISAIENYRDAEGVSDFEFALWMQQSGPDTDAHIYLNDGVQTCVCPPCYNACCFWNTVADARDHLVGTDTLTEDDRDLAYVADKVIRELGADHVEDYNRLSSLASWMECFTEDTARALRPIIVDALGWDSINAA